MSIKDTAVHTVCYEENDMDKDYKKIQLFILLISLCIMISVFRLYFISLELKEEVRVHLMLLSAAD